jgi:hypothetical protein
MEVPLEGRAFARVVDDTDGDASDGGILIDAARRMPQIRSICVVHLESLRGLKIPVNIAAHVNLLPALSLLCRPRGELAAEAV